MDFFFKIKNSQRKMDLLRRRFANPFWYNAGQTVAAYISAIKEFIWIFNVVDDLIFSKK